MSKKIASQAVMEKRAPRVVEDDTPEKRLWRNLDYYPTPPWAARAGAELIQALAPQTRSVWEPFCGEGHMAGPLAEYFPEVRASDLYAFGYGETADFFETVGEADWIVSNPPFVRAAEAIERALTMARIGVAMLCRVAFVESVDRYDLLYTGKWPMTTFAPFVERVPMQLGSWDPELSTASAYAWFVFQKGRNLCDVKPIPPGTRERLHRLRDLTLWAKPEPMPLLDRVALPGFLR